MSRYRYISCYHNSPEYTVHKIDDSSCDAEEQQPVFTNITEEQAKYLVECLNHYEQYKDASHDIDFNRQSEVLIGPLPINTNTPKERVANESLDLIEKIRKLEAFLEKQNEERTVSNESYMLLVLQLTSMRTYYEILCYRLQYMKE